MVNAIIKFMFIVVNIKKPLCQKSCSDKIVNVINYIKNIAITSFGNKFVYKITLRDVLKKKVRYKVRE